MGLLGNIVSKILNPFGGSSDAKAADAPATTTGTAPSTSGTAPSTGGTADPATTGALPGAVDVSEVFNQLAAKNADKNLNWKTSIVDLLKLIGVDSSLAARKELADELHYTGDKSDTATMNIWLHKQVLKKLADNGGKVPQDLLT